MGEAGRILSALGLDGVATDPAFTLWRDGQPRITIDGETLWVRGGDQLADADQLLLEWIARTGRAEETAIRQAADRAFSGDDEEGMMQEFSDFGTSAEGTSSGVEDALADVERIRPGSALGNAGLTNAAPAPGSLFEKLRTNLKRIKVEGETLFLAEGDTLLDEQQLRAYADAREQQEKLRAAVRAASGVGLGTEQLGLSRGLVAQTQGGKIVRWKPGTVLTYRVARASFGDDARYQAVVDGMAQATTAWMQTCGCSFRHVQALDNRPGTGPEGAVFTVLHFDTGGQFIAAAFFPNDPRSRWRVLVDPSFFADDLLFDKIGVFRHELGHVLGFRHEHIRSDAPPACPDEPLFDTKNLGKYDPQSVMHYFCGGVGSKDLRITSIDRTGAQQVYGPPFTNLAFVEDDGL